MTLDIIFSNVCLFHPQWSGSHVSNKYFHNGIFIDTYYIMLIILIICYVIFNCKILGQ